MISQVRNMSVVRLHSSNFADVDDVAITFRIRHTLIMLAMFSSFLLIAVDSFFRVWVVVPFAASAMRPIFHHTVMQHSIVSTPLHRK